MLLSMTGNVVCVSSTKALYKGFVVKGNDDILRATLGVDEFQLVCQLWRTFEQRSINMFQISPACKQCYRTLAVRHELYRQ